MEDAREGQQNNETLLYDTEGTLIQTKYGEFLMYAGYDSASAKEFYVLIHGDIMHAQSPLVRIHSSCLTSEVFGSLMCDCKEQLEYAQQQIVSEGAGMIIYLNQEGRNLGIKNKLRIYRLMQNLHISTYEACDMLGIPRESRSYYLAQQILHHFHIHTFRLLTNNPDKIGSLSEEEFSITQVPVIILPNEHSERYLRSKQFQAGHKLGFEHS